MKTSNKILEQQKTFNQAWISLTEAFDAAYAESEDNSEQLMEVYEFLLEAAQRIRDRVGDLAID